MSKQIKATQFIDPGHSWLAVKRKLLSELGILDKVSSFSYQKGNTVYLEEDCDVNLLAKIINADKLRYSSSTSDNLSRDGTKLKLR